MKFYWKIILNLIFANIVFFLMINITLPNVNNVLEHKFEPYIIFKDIKGNLIATYGDIKYKDVELEEIPPYLINSLIALEDKRFWSHFGVDVLGIFRALSKNLQSKKIVEGGSTITQQLAKNLLQLQTGKIPSRSYIRKIREAVLALKLEYYFTKKEILKFYLNRVYFGSRTYGVNAACWKYFGKDIKNITLFESSALVSLLKAPSHYSNNEEKLTERILFVLSNMLSQNYITYEEKNIALLNKSKLIHNIYNKSIYYLTDWIVYHQIPSWILDMKRNLEITTTIDLEIQQHANNICSNIYKEYGKKWNFEHLALIAADYNGHIKAMIGGSEYKNGGFNRSTQASRQTGSIFKFFVYLSALKYGVDPSTLIDDSSPNINGWSPSNYYHKEVGFLPMKEGFIKSINGITVRLAHHVGIDNIIEIAHQLGLKEEIPSNLSVSLGSSNASLLELSQSFGTIALKGKKYTMKSIVQIIDKDKDIVLMKIDDQEQENIISQDIAQKMGCIMKDVISPQGTGRSIKLPYPASGKSGSSQEYRDFWFVGFTPNLIVGTWCGNDDYLKSMKLNKGANPSVIAWRDFLLKVNPKESEIKAWKEFFIPKKYKTNFLEDIIIN